jgi:hypothetical protein
MGEVDRPSLVFIDFDIPAFVPGHHRVTMKNVVFWDIKNPSSYLTGKTLRLRYRSQAVNTGKI